MSETASFVDPVFLARFGLSRVNVIDYMLHPLNPFKTTSAVNTSNEILSMQGISIGMFMMQGPNGEPMSPIAAEQEYQRALARLKGEQYELLPPSDPAFYIQPCPLYTIRHVLRTSPTLIKVIGIYYVVEGVIYKSPAVRSLMKANIARTLDGLSGACQALSACARYHPAIGHLWVFEEGGLEDTQNSEDSDKKRDSTDEINVDDDDDEKKQSIQSPMQLIQLSRRLKRRKILDNRRPGERTPAEEEGIRASEAIDQILVRLSKSPMVAATTKSATSGIAPASNTANLTTPTKQPITQHDNANMSNATLDSVNSSSGELQIS